MPKSYKIDWPPAQDLLVLVIEKGFQKVRKELGVSDNAVRKTLGKYGITITGRGKNKVFKVPLKFEAVL